MFEELVVVVLQIFEVQLDLLCLQVFSELVDLKFVVLDDLIIYVEKGGDDEEVDFRLGSFVEKGGNIEEVDFRLGNYIDFGEKVERLEDCVCLFGLFFLILVLSIFGFIVMNCGLIMDNIYGKSELIGGELV